MRSTVAFLAVAGLFFTGTLYALSAEKKLLQQEILFPNLTLGQKEALSEIDKLRFLKVKATWIDGKTVQQYTESEALAENLSLASRKKLAKSYASHQNMDIAYVFLVEIENSTTLFSSLSFPDPQHNIYLLVNHKQVIYPWFLDAAFTKPFTDTIKGRVFFRKNSGRDAVRYASDLQLVVTGLIPPGTGGVLSMRPDFMLPFHPSSRFWQGLSLYPPPQGVEDWVEKGITLFKEGYVEPSITFLQKAYAEVPSLMHGLLLSEALLKGAPKRSLPILQELDKAYPGQPSVAFHFGLYFETLKKCQRAIPYYEKASQGEPQDVETMRHLAHCLEREKQFDQATKWYQKILKISPDDREAQQKGGY